MLWHLLNVGGKVMKRLVEASMQKGILMIVCVALILVWGGISAFQMQRDYLP